MKPDKKIIGRWDYADFLDFKIKNIPVKIDTGAYTSSLRCSSIEEIISEDGNILRFTILKAEHSLPVKKRTFETSDYSIRKVKNSGGGIAKKRYSIKTTIEIFNEPKRVEFTLAERHGLRFPVLLGRKFLGKEYLVDPSKARLSDKKRKK